MKELGKEEIPLHEDVHIDEIVQDMQGFLERTYAPGKTKRHFHPKMHGCLKATFEVKEDLPSHLKKGLFSKPNTYDAWVRFSSAPPKEASDKKPSGLGMAIKVMGVDGDFIEPNAEMVQDFLMTTSPVLSPGHVANYRRAMKMLIYGLPHTIFYVLDPSNWRRITLTLKYRKRFYNVLEQMYFSGAPMLFGEGAAVKCAVKPHKSKTSGKPQNATDFFLQQRLMEDLAMEDAYFDFMVQFQEDPASEPIEDTSRQWKTTFHTVATICIPKQEFSSQERITLGENLQFNPWHALKSHRPLGGINRARKAVYGILADFRKQRNGVEP
ncbi:catalase [Echinicola sp. CAU 1574]|uniref:Catalase n=1 Tax=Echinicola arenosa TaxID=2774144 RepID=A0ABR9ALU3_9BACT|nr:catalase [Echinicola arenosa]MBD8489306.1 catalase [Echinicola arenosa]